VDIGRSALGSTKNMPTKNTIKYGDEQVPLIYRNWNKVENKPPYKKTYKLNPGESWFEAEVTLDQGEHYVQRENDYVPVGAMIAAELHDQGAEIAVFTECWAGRTVLVDKDLICVSMDGSLGDLLDRLYKANGSRWAGLPDVIAIFPDGRIGMREAKLSKKDRLSQNQHEFAKISKKLLGDELDLAVVEWG
jgi:hypothetical protein